MSEAPPSNKRYRTLSKALAIIDPQGVLMPGTVEHNMATEMILSWMAEMESDGVLSLSTSAKRLVRFKVR